jgi:membrane-anchored glycerophosphoryl diester phosphodiesterase (GDPDase)
MRGWSDSRALTRQSWAVLKDNRYLMAYPVVGIVAGIMPFGVIAGGVFFIALNQNWIGWALVVIGLYLLTLVTAVVQAALTVSAAAELEGGHSSLGHGLGTAFGRLGRLARWAFGGTVVNLLVGLLRGNNSGGLVSVIFRNVLAAAADVMWQLITFFVMPAMMLDDLGMIDAIKKSASTFKQRWGTQLSGGVRIGGLIGLIAVLPAILALVIGVVLVTAGVPAAGVPLAVIGLIVLIVAGLILSAIRGVFSVVLYRFATQGICEGGFTEQQLAGAVKVKA